MSNTGNGTWFIRPSALAAITSAVAACAPVLPPAPAPPAPAPPPAAARPEAPVNPNLPAMPLATGPLEISVVYPQPGQLVASRDSTFVFGSVGNGLAFLTVNGTPSPVWPNGSFMVFLPVPSRENPAFELVARTEGDSAHAVIPIRLPTEPATPPAEPAPVPRDTISNRWAVIAPPAAADPHRIIWGPATPDPDTTRFFLFPGTVVRAVSPAGARTRVALDDDQHMTVATGDLVLQPATFVPPQRTVGVPTVTDSTRWLDPFPFGSTRPATEWVEITIPVAAPPAYHFVSEGNVLRLTLYGTRPGRAGDTTGTQQSTFVRDALLRIVEHSQTSTRSNYAFHLARDVYGYLASWVDGRFIIQLRRPPLVDAAAPLRGLRIAVDPGHPGLPGEPPGATGPTGLREPDAVLAVGIKLREMLSQAGAEPFMTRATPDPVGLNARPAMAAQANVHAFVSIHLNAVPDNVNPFRAHGTSTYYWHPHSRRLAELAHDAMLREMHLRDIGVRRDNFAVVRNPWMPAILAEGAFIILPDQEYALRTDEYQEAYARALLQGLESYFREIALGR